MISRGSSRGRPDDEHRLDQWFRGVELAGEHAPHQIHDALAKLAKVLADGGQWRREVARLGQVVKAHDAHILGTRIPDSCRARSSPSAIWSLAAKTAVGLDSLNIA